MPAAENQESLMRWVLFWVFVGLFVLIVTGTLLAVFLGFGRLEASERETLFRVFLLEIGAAVIALFYSIFRIKRDSIGEPRVRLNISDTADLRQLTDVKQLVGRTATLSLSKANGVNIKDDLTRKILDDNGPYIPLDLPPLTHDVYVTVKIGTETYSGSFVVGTHLVGLGKSEA